MHKTQSKLVLVKQGRYEYIYIYYKFKNKLIRINTGNQYKKSFMRNDLYYNTKMFNYAELNEKTKELKRRVDEYISFKLKHNWKSISNKECSEYIYGEYKSIYQFKYYHLYQEEKSKRVPVVQHLDNFNQFKKEELNNRPSYKDYLSMVNSIKDYEKFFNTKLTFDEMNKEEFLVKYRNFLAEERGDEYLTRGGLNDNTINKRFACLKTFFRWIERRDIYKFHRNIFEFKTPKYDNNIVALDKTEIKQLKELKIENKTQAQIRDIFVCNCFLGLRYSDVHTLTKNHFQIDDDGDYVLIKENVKTGTVVQIPVMKTALEILKKYDFELPKYAHQYFNRQLTDIFKKYELFGDVIVKKRRVNKANKDKTYLKRELIASHTCRRTFITLAISENVPINVIMLATGHKKIQTLQKYTKLVQNKESFKKIDL